MNDLAEKLKPGVLFGRYEIVRCIKAGGMGAIYEVIHPQLKGRFALKVMLGAAQRDDDLVERFKREASITADIDSDHIVKTIDADVDAETNAPFLVMELLKGEDLGSRLSRTGPLSGATAVAVLSQVARALEKTHSKKIVHRDLKPENLFVVERDDEELRIKILDFGIAKVITPEGPSTTRVIGSPLYMPSEQLQGSGNIDHTADLYAVGHIAFTLLVGRAYWDEEANVDPNNIYPVMMAVCAGATEPASSRAKKYGVDLPVAFDPWFAKATALRSEHRFTSAKLMIEELATALSCEASFDVRSRPSLDPVSGKSASTKRGRSKNTLEPLIEDDRAITRIPGEGKPGGKFVMMAALAFVAVAGGAFVVTTVVSPAAPASGASSTEVGVDAPKQAVVVTVASGVAPEQPVTPLASASASSAASAKSASAAASPKGAGKVSATAAASATVAPATAAPVPPPPPATVAPTAAPPPPPPQPTSLSIGGPD